MKANNITEASKLVNMQISNVIIIEENDENERQYLFSNLFSKINQNEDKQVHRIFTWDEYNKFNEFITKPDTPMNNQKLSKGFDKTEIKLDVPNVSNTLKAFEVAMASSNNFVQITLDNDVFMGNKANTLIKSFIRNIYSNQNEKLNEEVIKHQVFSKSEKLNTNHLDCTQDSLLVIVTNNYEDFLDLDDMVILVKSEHKNKGISNKILTGLFENIEIEKSDELVNKIKSLTKPLSLTQLTNLFLYIFDENMKDEEELIKFIKDYIIKVLPNDGVLTKMDGNIFFDSIGGYENVKGAIKENILNVWDKQEIAKKFNLEYEKGIILFGAPGTGKSMFASAIGNELSIPSFKFDISKIKSKWVGESEQNLRNMFEIIENSSPCVLFIDEIDNVGQNRENGQTSHNVDRNMINMLLEYISSPNRKALIVGATNLINELDPALIRDGRLGSKFFIPYPNFEARKEIIDININKKREIGQNIDISTVALATDKMSGAEIEKIINDVSIKVLITEGRESVNTYDLINFIKNNYNLPTNRDSQISFFQEQNRIFSSFQKQEDGTKIVLENGEDTKVVSKKII